MKLRKPWMIKLAARLGVRVLRLWMSTIRCRTDAQGQRTDPWDPTVRERYIYAYWHEYLFMVPAVRSAAPVTALVSHSADGELLNQICQSCGMNTVRGSSTRGGMGAMEGLLDLGGNTHLVVAPDGPRGPRREVKRGLVYLASWTQRPIVPVGVGFSRAWRVRSWDRMAVPKPFSTIAYVAGPVIRVPPGLGKAAMEQYRRLTEQTIEAATAAAEAWARGGDRPPVAWPTLGTAAAA